MLQSIKRKNIFNVEYQYQLYLERVSLKESEMNPIQRVETKRAFMGACGQMLLVLRDDVSELPTEEIAADTLESMLDQVAKYFMKEVLTHQISKN